MDKNENVSVDPEDDSRALAMATVGSKGQIVIPKYIRDIFQIKSGDRVMILADKKRGIAIVKEGFAVDVTSKALGEEK